MTALIRGGVIKTVSTRTALGYLAIGTALAVVNVLIVSQFSVLDTVSDKRDALAGLPILLLLFGLVGAAGEYRHGTAAPAALVARRGRGWLLVTRAGAYPATGPAIAAGMVAVSLAFLGMELLAAVNEDAVGFTPFGAAAILAGDPGGGTLSWGAAALVMAIWMTPLLIAAIAAERRRDLA